MAESKTLSGEDRGVKMNKGGNGKEKKYSPIRETDDENKMQSVDNSENYSSGKFEDSDRYNRAKKSFAARIAGKQ